MRSEPARLGGVSLDFARIPLRRGKKFPYEHVQVGQPTRWDSIFFNQFCFTFQMLIK